MNRTVLHAVQAAAGGKFIDFNGWEMPVQFSGIGPEHTAVRTACGVFDLNHMGRLRIRGTGSLDFLRQAVSRKVDDLAPGRIRYGMVLAEDGTVEDDVLVGRENADSWHVVVNASNLGKLLSMWRRPPAGVTIEDLSLPQAMLAVQGPKALDLLASLGLDGRSLRNYAFTDVAWRGTTVRISRTGYTGEDGAELFLPDNRAAELWSAVVAAGALPCGLGCRDTLRLEAAMPLYGHELDRTVTPLEAGLEFAVDPAGSFIGATALAAQRASGPKRRLVGLRCREKRVPRQGYAVLHQGVAVGTITSGTLSPTLGVAIGMAYVASAHAAIGSELTVDIRGTAVAAEVVALPFYKRS